MQRAILALAGAFVVIAVAAAIFFSMRPEPVLSPAAVNVTGAEIGGPFELVSHKGETVTAEDVITGPTLIYFGYTFCPDICPVDVQQMADAVDLLAERGHEVTPVFVTVDPARDTPEQLAWFVDAMHPNMLGLTGSEEQVGVAAEAYKVYYSRVDVEGSEAEYLMSHTGFTYFMMPDGVAGLYRRGFPPEEIANDVARVLEARG